MRARRSRRSGAVGWAVVVVLALALGGCAIGGDSGDLPMNALDPAGRVARVEDRLWQIVFSIAVVVFVLVQTMIIFVMIRFRRRPGEQGLPKQTAGNTKLEVIWTLIPAGILAAIAVPTVATIFSLSGPPAGEPLEVRVVGKQYWWQFEYTNAGDEGIFTANELHIPIDRPVYLTLDGTDPDGLAADVVHSFWVPRLAGKQDYVPGHDRYLTIEADEPGVYPGQCAEFCGLSHANMRFTVVAQEPAAFEAWLAEHQEPAPAVEELDGLAALGARAFAENQCIACHAIAGYETDQGALAEARVGPDLTHFNSRETFAGGIFDVDDTEQLRAWITNAPQEKPGAQMPNLPLTDEAANAIIAYLRTLD